MSLLPSVVRSMPMTRVALAMVSLGISLIVFTETGRGQSVPIDRASDPSPATEPLAVTSARVAVASEMSQNTKPHSLCKKASGLTCPRPEA